MEPARHQAIANNMDWYEAQCAAHGIACTRSAESWFTASPMPPFYSNLVWADSHYPAEPLQNLQATGLARWSVKDALGQWDLARDGLTKLFDAEWYVRPASSAPLPSEGSVATMRTSAELNLWIKAWGETPAGTRVFVDDLLANPDVSFMMFEPPDAPPGGLIANRSAACMGLSNFFGPIEGVARCIAAVSSAHPTLPLVGYDRVEDLDALRTYGFRATGPLAVWISALP